MDFFSVLSFSQIHFFLMILLRKEGKEENERELLGNTYDLLLQLLMLFNN
jgi:hypothetical protein